MDRRSSMVKTAALELTTRCRLECPKCERTLMKKKEKLANVDMTMELVDFYCASAFDKIILSGSYGDPIYHPNFLEVVKRLKAAGKVIWISTNGSGKSKEFFRELFTMLDIDDQVSFAVDGYYGSAGGYRVNFTESDFEQVIEILEMGSKEFDVRVRWQYIPFSFNEQDIEKARDLAHSKNIHFMVKKSTRWDGPDDPMMPKDKSLVGQFYLDHHEFIDS